MKLSEIFAQKPTLRRNGGCCLTCYSCRAGLHPYCEAHKHYVRNSSSCPDWLSIKDGISIFGKKENAKKN